jgi:hypothetical protein
MAEVTRRENPLEEQVIEEFLEGQPRAEEWKELTAALQGRLKDAREQRDALPADDPRRADWEARIAELNEQIAVLATEAAITEFVEDSVRMSLSRPRRPGMDEDDDEFAIEGYG